jgi:hypothetical protein
LDVGAACFFDFLSDQEQMVILNDEKQSAVNGASIVDVAFLRHTFSYETARNSSRLQPKHACRKYCR